jgi:molybdenum cofactor guanylyltransferase
MTKRAAIILAGGKAKRFQTAKDEWQDKALAKLDGKPLIIHAIEHVQDIVEEIIVVVNENKSRIFQYHDVLEKYHVQKTRIITDLKIKNLSGPLIAILTGLKFSEGNSCITVPCDVPMLNGKVAEYMFKEINDSFVAVPMWPNGRLETLLMVLDRKKTLEIANVLCQLGRSHPDDIIRGSLKTLFISPLGEIKVLDPNLSSFVNINCQEDLCRLQPRHEQGQFVENVRLNLGVVSIEKILYMLAASSKRDNSDFLEASQIFSSCAMDFENEGQVFWAAVNREYEAKSLLSLFEKCNKPEIKTNIKEALLKAAKNYGLEAKIYEKNRCYLLAERAEADKTWSELQAEKLGVK